MLSHKLKLILFNAVSNCLVHSCATIQADLSDLFGKAGLDAGMINTMTIMSFLLLLS